MGGIGVGLLWTSYFLGFWGYTLLKNYNVTAGMLLSPNWPPTTVDNGSANDSGNLPNLAPGYGIDPTKPYGGYYRPPGSK